MEASGTPTPPPERPPQETPPPPPPPPRGTAPVDEGKAGGGWRALGVVLALALAFACAVMVAVMVDFGESPRCDDRAAIEAERQETGELEIECFDASSAQKVASLVLGWPSAILAGIAALLALFFAATGRRGRLLLQLTALAIVLGVLSILVSAF